MHIKHIDDLQVRILLPLQNKNNKIMVKFKFLNFSIPIEYIDTDDFLEVENPIGLDNLPDGEYMVRGDKKGQRKEYWHLNNGWFLVANVLRDNGHYYCDSTKYLLFPSLPEKDWEHVEKVGWKRLNKEWQRHLQAYHHWLDLRKITRDMKLYFLK